MTTWSLSFEQVEQSDPTAAELLRFLAFLAPDAIPEELIVAGASQLGPQLQPIASDETLLDEAIGTLRRYSLVQRNTDQRLLAIHRLVQAVLKATMTDGMQRQWAERAVRAVNKAFPNVNDITKWPQCERYLPHALVCAALIDSYALEFSEAARLLNQTAYYLYEHLQYERAEPLIKCAFAIWEQALGPTHPDTVISLNNLAELYRKQGKYKEAEPLYQRAIEIDQAVYGSDHPELTTDLSNLAGNYQRQGKYEQAEPLYQRALVICEKVFGPNYPTTKIIRENYDGLLEEMKRNRGG